MSICWPISILNHINLTRAGSFVRTGAVAAYFCCVRQFSWLKVNYYQLIKTQFENPTRYDSGEYCQQCVCEVWWRLVVKWKSLRANNNDKKKKKKTFVAFGDPFPGLKTRTPGHTAVKPAVTECCYWRIQIDGGVGRWRRDWPRSLRSAHLAVNDVTRPPTQCYTPAFTGARCSFYDVNKTSFIHRGS